MFKVLSSSSSSSSSSSCIIRETDDIKDWTALERDAGQPLKPEFHIFRGSAYCVCAASMPDSQVVCQ